MGVWPVARDHRFTIAPAPGAYSDEVTVEADRLMPSVAAVARLFYAHRQRRWHGLIARDALRAERKTARPDHGAGRSCPVP